MRKQMAMAGLVLVLSTAATAQTTVTNGNNGTTNTVPVYTGTATLGNSPITVSGSNVGIGTTSPNARLEVSTSSGNNAIQVTNSSVNKGWVLYPVSNGSNTDIRIYENLGGDRVTFQSGGNVGIGTGNPISALTLGGTGNPNPNSGAQIDYAGENLTFTNYMNGLWELGGIRMVQPNGYYGDRGNMVFTVGIGRGSTLDAMTIQSPTGNVGIGTASPGTKLEVNGSVKLTSGSGASITFADGTTQSTAFTGVLCGGDYAESVDPTGERAAYTAGDVLILDETSPGKIAKSTEPYSTLVAGVYSTKPGVVGRRQTTPKTDAEVPMAMVGIVPTKVSTENGPIHVGDLLVSSSKAGYAMKGTDRGRMLGAVLGKAMNSLESGDGVIEVLVTLQ